MDTKDIFNEVFGDYYAKQAREKIYGSVGTKQWTIANCNEGEFNTLWHDYQEFINNPDYAPIHDGTGTESWLIFKALCSLPEEIHRKLLAGLEKELIKRIKENPKGIIHHVPPNFDVLQTIKEKYTETETTGFFGLQKKTVVKERHVKNPDYQKIEDYGSFIFLKSHRANEGDAVYGIEYDDAFLLTESGRFVDVLYCCDYSDFSTEIYEVNPVSYQNLHSNMITAILLSHYFGFFELNEIWDSIINDSSNNSESKSKQNIDNDRMDRKVVKVRVKKKDNNSSI